MSSSSQVSARFWAWAGANRRSSVQSRRIEPGPELPGRGERRLIREALPGGGELVASNHALYVHDGDPAVHGWRRIRWADVRAVGRSGARRQESVMTVRLRTPPPGNLTFALRVGPRSRMPDLASHMAASTMIATRRVVMSNAAGVTFVALRDPETGGVAWSIEFERDGDRNDSALQAEVATVLREIRSLMGC